MAALKLSKLFLVAALLVPAVGAPTLALSMDTKTVDQVAHAIECAAWLVSDKAKHDEMCLPKDFAAAPVFVSSSTGNNAFAASGHH